MQNIIYTLVIALTSNIDNFCVRIAYSIKGIRITITNNIFIAIITFVISSLAVYFGNYLSSFMSIKLCKISSMLIFLCMGLYIILESEVKKIFGLYKCKNKKKIKCVIVKVIKKPENADLDNSKDMDFVESLLLGVVLSINNLGSSISAGIMGLDFLFVGLFSAVISFLSFLAGNILAKYRFDKKVSIISAIILILMGIRQVI